MRGRESGLKKTERGEGGVMGTENTGTNGCRRDEVNWKQEEANLKQ